MRPRPLLLGLPPALSAGRRRPALALVLILGLAMSPIVAASGVGPGARPAAALAAPVADPREPRPLAAPLPEPFGITSRISERQGGGDAAGASAEASISADGRYVAFSSISPDLAADDNNSAQDIFVRDRATGVTIRLPLIDRQPIPAGGRASEPAISPDGGFVAFTYTPPTSTSLRSVAGGPFVMLWDAASGTTKVAAVDRAGRPAPGSSEPDVSLEGRYVAYTSLSSNITPGDANKQADVFRVDTQTGDTTMISQTPSRTSPRGTSRNPSISYDGNIVAFTSNAPNILVPDPTPTPPPPVPTPSPSPDESCCDSIDMVPPALGQVGLAAGIGVGSGHRQAPMQASAPPGSVVATGVLANSVAEGSTTLIVNVNDCPFAVTSVGAVGPGRLFFSGDESQDILAVSTGPGPGQQTLAITSTFADQIAGTNLSQTGVPNCHASGGGTVVTGPGVSQVYARNVPAGSTELVSMTPSGAPGSGQSISPSISADGSVIAFVSFGTDLAPGDGDSAGDIYIRERNVPRTSLLTADLPDAGQPSISGDSRYVVFSSPPAAGGGGLEVYHRDRFTFETIHISVALAGGDGGENNVGPSVSSEGRFVAWSSTSPRLITGDGNGISDVFVRELPPAGTGDPTALDFGTRALGTSAPPAAVTLTSIGWTPLSSIAAAIDGGNAGDFSIVVDGCTGIVLARPTSCTITVTFSPQEVGPRSSTLRITHNGVGSPHTVRLTGVGSKAELKVDPPRGPPGIVTIATGKGFPPNTPLVLTWSVGITQKTAPVVTDAKGVFRAQVLVFHHDVQGLRDLTASPADGKAFQPIAVAFFVTTPTGTPPGFDPTVPGPKSPQGFFR